MKTLDLESVLKLLGTPSLGGSEKELKSLCIRITELVRLNGEKWVEENRQKLLDEWKFIVGRGIIA